MATIAVCKGSLRRPHLPSLDLVLYLKREAQLVLLIKGTDLSFLQARASRQQFC